MAFGLSRKRAPQRIAPRELDVPVRVNGRHWGGFRTAYKL
jgi:methyl-accepting chemotaxis protein